jgi:hypothetical protein
MPTVLVNTLYVVYSHLAGEEVTAKVLRLCAGPGSSAGLPLWKAGAVNGDRVQFVELLHALRAPAWRRFLFQWPFAPALDQVYVDPPLEHPDCTHDSAYPAVALLAACIARVVRPTVNLVVSATFGLPRPTECFTTAALEWPQDVVAKVQAVRRRMALDGTPWAVVVGSRGATVLDAGGNPVPLNPRPGERLVVPPDKKELTELNGIVPCENLHQVWKLLERGRLPTL